MLAALDHGPVARSTVARLAGLSPAVVSRQCAELIRRGFLREYPADGGEKPAGRPHVPVGIDSAGPVACGVHIALRHTTLALVDLRGRVIARERVPHDGAPDPDHVLDRIAARLAVLTGSGAGQHRQVLGIGVATGGRVDPDTAVIAGHPLLGWRDVRVGELLGRRTGLPVRADGHARALVRAEQLFGDPRARSSVVQLFVGNVVEAAFAVGGAVQQGPRSAAGTVAHLPVPGRAERCECGRSGCLQAVVSDGALAARARAAGIAAGPPLLDAALSGDPRAAILLRQRARAIGAAAAVLLDLLDPEVLVVVEAGAMLLPGNLEVLRAEVRRQAGTEPPVVASSFGRDALAVAAGTVFLSEIYANPLTI